MVFLFVLIKAEQSKPTGTADNIVPSTFVKLSSYIRIGVFPSTYHLVAASVGRVGMEVDQKYFQNTHLQI